MAPNAQKFRRCQIPLPWPASPASATAAVDGKFSAVVCMRSITVYCDTYVKSAVPPLHVAAHVLSRAKDGKVAVGGQAWGYHADGRAPSVGKVSRRARDLGIVTRCSCRPWMNLMRYNLQVDLSASEVGVDSIFNSFLTEFYRIRLARHPQRPPSKPRHGMPQAGYQADNP